MANSKSKNDIANSLKSNFFENGALERLKQQIEDADKGKEHGPKDGYSRMHHRHNRSHTRSRRKQDIIEKQKPNETESDDTAGFTPQTI